MHFHYHTRLQFVILQLNFSHLDGILIYTTFTRALAVTSYYRSVNNIRRTVYSCYETVLNLSGF